MTIGERIKQRRIELGLSVDEVAEKLGKNRATVYRYESNEIENLPVGTLEPLSKILETTPAHLMGWDEAGSVPKLKNLDRAHTKKVPLLGEGACGIPKYAYEDETVFVSASDEITADFCLKCVGDSMINAGIHDNDIVFIRKQETVNNGEIAVVIIDDSATLKRFFYNSEKDLIILKAENSQFDDFIYTRDQFDEIKIIGKAVALQRRLR